MEVTRLFSLPEDFIIACEICHVNPADLLQTFIEHVTVYGVFNSYPSQEEPQAIASVFCQNYFLHLNNTRTRPHIPPERKTLHSKHIAPILLSIQKGKKPDTTTYSQLILNWYKEIKLAIAFDDATGNNDQTDKGSADTV